MAWNQATYSAWRALQRDPRAWEELGELARFAYACVEARTARSVDVAGHLAQDLREWASACPAVVGGVVDWRSVAERVLEAVTCGDCEGSGSCAGPGGGECQGCAGERVLVDAVPVHQATVVESWHSPGMFAWECPCGDEFAGATTERIAGTLAAAHNGVQS